MATRQEEFIAGEDLDDLYALLDNGFLDEDVDFEKDLAALVIEESPEENSCCDECSKVCKTQRGLRRHKNTKHSSSRSGSGVSVSSEEIIQKKFVSMTCVYFRKKSSCLDLKILFNCYKN